MLIPILTALAVLVPAGLLCALLLSLAARFFAVSGDPKTDAVRDCLPGANCGGCGFAGCDDYAAALIRGEVAPTLCNPGGEKTVRALSGALGLSLDDGAFEKKVAFVACRGDCHATKEVYDYRGMTSCAATAALVGGKQSCPSGCLGLGDCAAACPTGAIAVRSGLAQVDPALCHGCGLCAAQCPRSLISVVPVRLGTRVACSDTSRGAVTRKQCVNGCIGCKKCEKVCPTHAVTVENNLAHVDPALCRDCGECAAVCPVGAIRPAAIRYA